jgi:hypothetical protein
MFEIMTEQNEVHDTKHDHEQHENHEALFNQEWEKSQLNQIIKGFKDGRPLSELVAELPGFKESFQHPLDCLDCADGRVCSGRKLGLAGQGILLGADDQAKLDAKIAEIENLTISGHENCGAAGIACQGAPDSDEQGYAYTKELAARNGRPYKEIHKDEFRCAVHNERCLVLEGTGRFDVANLQGFPGQFISSAEYFGLSEEYQMTEAKALIGIALSSHSFGERFDQENPFYLLISADNQEQLDKMKSWAEKVAADYEGRVKVDAFIAPEK